VLSGDRAELSHCPIVHVLPTRFGCAVGTEPTFVVFEFDFLDQLMSYAERGGNFVVIFRIQ
jgi:hypothetical protein